MPGTKTDFCVLAAFLFAALTQAGAQVVLPQEIKDPAARGLQVKYLAELKTIGAAIQSHRFPYPFYFSRTLGLDEEQQRRFDQRSIRFEKYKGQLVLEITGNYYASYSTEAMDRGQRARRTFFDVMLPLLEAAAARFANDENFEAYGLEISHHIRRKVLGVSTENVENVVLILPRAAAERLVAAKTPGQQQSALLEGEAFVNAEPCSLWLTDNHPPEAEPSPTKNVAADLSRGQPAAGAAASPRQIDASASRKQSDAAASAAAVPPAPAKPPDPAARAVTPESLAGLQTANQELLARLAKELEPQAHFVSYAPPSFIAFRQGAYLQLSITTALDASAAGSRYKLAALAFDEHVARLIRPVLGYFPQDPAFDGIDFSASVRLPGAASSLAVEFIFSFSALRCYAQYDCTGQQLINSGFVLINGERAGLDLQTAEAK